MRTTSRILRDELGAPGPGPDESMAKLGYYSQFRDQSITIASIRQLVAANVNAFPHTQVIATTLNPEIVRELLADDVTKKLSAPVGIRSDCIGVIAPMPGWAVSDGSHYVLSKDPLIAQLKDRLASAPVLTEWCLLPPGTDRRSYYARGLHDVIKYHVSMTSSVDFEDTNSTTPMDPGCTCSGRRANIAAGYRYSVEARPGSQSIRDGVASIAVTWTNYGSAAATEKWVPGYRLVDFSGTAIRTLPATVNLKTLSTTTPATRARSRPRRRRPKRCTSTWPAWTRGTTRWGVGRTGNNTSRTASHVVNYPPMHAGPRRPRRLGLVSRRDARHTARRAHFRPVTMRQ